MSAALERAASGWILAPLAVVLENLIDFRGRTPKKLGMVWDGGEIHALSALNVRMGYIDFSRTKHFGSPDLYRKWMTSGDAREGDIVVTTEAPLGNVAQIPDSRPYIMSQRVILLQPDRRLTVPKFLAYQLRSPRFQDLLARNDSGTTVRGIRQSRLVKLDVCLPPLNEQRRIVAKIDVLTAKSRRAKEALDAIPPLLERFRQSILAAAFRGDLTADWRAKHPDVEPVGETLSRVQVDQSRTGRSATVNVISGRAGLAVGHPNVSAPAGWEWIPLRAVARLESGHTPSRKHPEYWGGDIPWIGIKDAREHHGRRIRDTHHKTNERGLANSAARLLPAGTVCLSRTASVGYTVIMDRPMATSQDFINWICSDALEPSFLMYSFLAEGEHLLKFGKGTTHTTIYFPEVKAFHICLPPLEEQRAIVDLVRARLATVDALHAQIEAGHSQAEVIDQAILAKAFRGELVAQDPTDEPASVLLERIRAERAMADQAKRRRKRRVGGAAADVEHS